MIKQKQFLEVIMIKQVILEVILIKNRSSFRGNNDKTEVVLQITMTKQKQFYFRGNNDKTEAVLEAIMT